MPRETLDAAAGELVDAIDDAVARLLTARERTEVVRAGLAEGVPLPDLVRAEMRPLVVEVLTDVQEGLQTAGSRFRRAEARALHREGLSMEAIAALFGVTRQRVSALLRRQS
ncbi:MAG: hypothetical protein M3P93_01045 [Actinomycetota bacterium]|nr:hypothetical protein [Actinomycetota bacterium]